MAIINLKEAIISWLRVVTQNSDPATPASGYGVFYDKLKAPYFRNSDGTVISLTPSAPVLNDYIKVSDVKASGTNGGDAVGGSWVTRVINTKDSDDGGHCSIASNQITLVAGTYICHASAPAYAAPLNHQVKLYNATDAADVLLGTSERVTSGVGVMTRSFVSGKFVLSATKALEIRHRCNTSKTVDGLGTTAGWGNEVYTVAEFWKVA